MFTKQNLMRLMPAGALTSAGFLFNTTERLPQMRDPISKKKVVVIGSGFAGASVASLLEDSFEVTIISQDGCFRNMVANYRIVVDPSLEERNRLALEDYAPKARLHRGQVVEVDRETVTISTKSGASLEQEEEEKEMMDTEKSTIPYDYLVVASGARCANPVPTASPTLVTLVPLTDARQCASSYEQLRGAKSVCVLGGGASGVEVAADISERFKDLTVHIISGTKELLPRMPEAAQKIASAELASRPNVHLHLGHRAMRIERDSIVTDKGVTIPCSVVFLCCGFTPNSEFMRKHLPSCLNPDHSIRVAPTLQLLGRSATTGESEIYPNVFALGDVIALDEEKLAQNAFRHAVVVAQNIRRLAFSEGLSSQLSLYRPEPRRMCIMMGSENAVVVKGSNVETGRTFAVQKQGISLSATVLPKYCHTLEEDANKLVLVF